MSGLEMFSNGEFELDIQPHPVDKFRIRGTEVAKFLGYRNATDLARSIPDAEKGFGSVRTLGGDQRVLYLTLPGFIRAMGQRQASRIPDLENRGRVQRFQAWVFGDVVPQIFETGGYNAPATDEPQATAVATLPTPRELAVMLIESEDAKAALESRVAALEPLADITATMIATDGDLSINEAAKNLQRGGIRTGLVKLMQHLRNIRWVNAKNEPYQAQIHAGRMAVRLSSYVDKDSGERKIKTTPRITAKGLVELRKQMAAGVPQPRQGDTIQHAIEGES